MKLFSKLRILHGLSPEFKEKRLMNRLVRLTNKYLRRAKHFEQSIHELRRQEEKKAREMEEFQDVMETVVKNMRERKKQRHISKRGQEIRESLGLVDSELEDDIYQLDRRESHLMKGYSSFSDELGSKSQPLRMSKPLKSEDLQLIAFITKKYPEALAKTMGKQYLKIYKKINSKNKLSNEEYELLLEFQDKCKKLETLLKSKNPQKYSVALQELHKMEVDNRLALESCPIEVLQKYKSERKIETPEIEK